MPKYIFEIGIDLGKAVPAVGGILEELNSILAKYSVTEELSCHSTVITAELSVNRELTLKELKEAASVMDKILEERFAPKFNVKVWNVRRKSSNSKLSVE